MRFAIDVVFLDADLRVLDVIPGLGPWRLAARRGARAVLELAAGEASRRGLRRGDALELVASEGPPSVEPHEVRRVDVGNGIYVRVPAPRRQRTEIPRSWAKLAAASRFGTPSLRYRLPR